MNNLKESQVIKIWQELANSSRLVTERGEWLKVIYPGRINDDQGADFRDAVIATSNGVTIGDIEVHVKSSNWRAHRHHHDPVYNRVILHVVMWRDAEVTANHEDGSRIPTLALHKYIDGQDCQYRANTSCMPCRTTIECLSDNAVAQMLDTAGEERFLAKANQFHADLAKTEGSQCLYQGIMMALGYSKNQVPFLELARRLPIRIVESLAQTELTDEECLARQQALLLGTAGLLPSQRQIRPREGNLDDRWVDKLEQLWADFSPTEPMSYHDWHLFRVRPNNFPTRRIVAMSCLPVRYRERGVFDEIINMVRELPVDKDCHRLERGLLVTANGYWASHFDFGCRLASSTLLGRSRVADIIVNVLLPFTCAWGELTGQPELERNAINLYHRYPRLIENTVEGHMTKQLGLSHRLVNSARRQQGLIHIYKTLCTRGRCNCCPLMLA